MSRQWENSGEWAAEFWSRAERPVEGCWLWQWGIFQGDGYGQFVVAGTSVGAHRVAWFLEKGAITGQVLHRCDTPLCIRPDHLFLGTPLDNMQDKHAKGRQRYLKGEECPNARLKVSDVIRIRKMRSSGDGYQKIANVFGVSTQCVWDIVRRRRWAHVE